MPSKSKDTSRSSSGKRLANSGRPARLSDISDADWVVRIVAASVAASAINCPMTIGAFTLAIRFSIQFVSMPDVPYPVDCVATMSGTARLAALADSPKVVARELSSPMLLSNSPSGVAASSAATDRFSTSVDNSPK